MAGLALKVVVMAVAIGLAASQLSFSPNGVSTPAVNVFQLFRIAREIYGSLYSSDQAEAKQSISGDNAIVKIPIKNNEVEIIQKEKLISTVEKAESKCPEGEPCQTWLDEYAHLLINYLLDPDRKYYLYASNTLYADGDEEEEEEEEEEESDVDEDENAEDEGADGEGADDEGADGEGADGEGADGEGADDEGSYFFNKYTYDNPDADRYEFYHLFKTNYVVFKWTMAWVGLIITFAVLIVVISVPYLVTGENFRSLNSGIVPRIDQQDSLLLLAWLLGEASGDESCLERVVCLHPERSARYLAIPKVISSSLYRLVPARYQGQLRHLDEVTYNGLHHSCQRYSCPVLPEL